jgi:hypothetical protein
MPTEAIVAREAVLTAIVSAKMRSSPRSSNPCRISSRAPLACQAAPPPTAQQAIAEFRLPVYRPLVSTFRRLQDPPADERAVDEPAPEAQSGNPGRGGKPSTMQDLHLRPVTCTAVAQVAHHLRIGVEFDLVLQVLVGQRHEPHPPGLQRGLRHGRMFASSRRPINCVSADDPATELRSVPKSHPQKAEE